MIEIIEADTSHLPLIKELAYTIWNVAYKEILSPQQLQYMLATMHSLPALQALLDGGHTFIIPFENGKALGYCCYKIYTDKTRLEKIYVLPDQHKKGIGNLLINYVIEKSKPFVNVLELNVNRNNKAISFYEKLGFTITSEVDVPIGEGYFMNDFIMQKALF